MEGRNSMVYYFVKEFFNTIRDTYAGETIIVCSLSSTECHLRDHYCHGGDGCVNAIT